MTAPGSTGSGESLTPTLISAVGTFAVVLVLEVLLPGTGSPVVEARVAVSVITVPSGVAGSTVTTRVSVIGPANAFMSACVQLTVPVPPTAGVVQEKLAGARDLNVVFAGIALVRVRLAAS